MVESGVDGGDGGEVEIGIGEGGESGEGVREAMFVSNNMPKSLTNPYLITETYISNCSSHKHQLLDTILQNIQKTRALSTLPLPNAQTLQQMTKIHKTGYKNSSKSLLHWEHPDPLNPRHNSKNLINLQKASKTQFSKVLNEQTPDIKKLQVLNRK